MTTLAWWQPEPLLRLLCDEICARVRRLCSCWAERARWCRAETPLASLGLDSLEFLELATLVATRFELYASGQDQALFGQRRPESMSSDQARLGEMRLHDWVLAIATSRLAENRRLGFEPPKPADDPRLCWHPTARLEQEATWFAAYLGRPNRLFGAVPARALQGFVFTLLLPALWNLPLRDVRAQSVASILRGLKPGDLLITSPTDLAQGAAALKRRATEPPGTGAVVVIIGGDSSPVRWQIWQESLAARVIAVHGGNHTGSIGIRETASAPLSLLPQWRRDPSDARYLLRQMPDRTLVRVMLPEPV
jgi:hypothetical protein